MQPINIINNIDNDSKQKLIQGDFSKFKMQLNYKLCGLIFFSLNLNLSVLPGPNI